MNTLPRYFGTDGIRGKAGDGCLSESFLHRVGLGYAHFLRARHSSAQRLRVVVGRDTRLSGPQLQNAFCAGLSEAGVDWVELGVVPTPAVALAVRTYAAAGGAVLTASHNPAHDNGIKFFDENGYKYSIEEELALEQRIDAAEGGGSTARAGEGTPGDGRDHYLAHLEPLLSSNHFRAGKIVLDLAHGATTMTSPVLLKELNRDLILLGAEPDGSRINAEVGSEHPQQMLQMVVHHQATLGIAHDGDGDRLVVGDEKGILVDGDQLLGIFALDALRKNKLGENTLVATRQSNLGLDYAIRRAGGKVLRVDIGDRNVLQQMLRMGATIGGENSGHYVFLDHGTTGDGLVAALTLLNVLGELDCPLSTLRNEVKLFPQLTAAVTVGEKIPLEQLFHLRRAQTAIEDRLRDTGRVLIRYSGTEPKIRLLVEGTCEETVAAAMKELRFALREDFLSHGVRIGN